MRATITPLRSSTINTSYVQCSPDSPNTPSNQGSRYSVHHMTHLRKSYQTSNQSEDTKRLATASWFSKSQLSHYSFFQMWDRWCRVSMQSSTPTHPRTHFSIQPGNEFYYSGYFRKSSTCIQFLVP